MGSIIGIVMGLTGAGGALVAIPLFMTVLRMELKSAAVYSLVTVVIASTQISFFRGGLRITNSPFHLSCLQALEFYN